MRAEAATIAPDGLELSGADVEVTPEMPDHGHGSTVSPISHDLGGGLYEVERIRLGMAGLWRIDVEVRSETISDKVTFRFCLE